MTDDQPQYAPGDPVLVAGEYVRAYHEDRSTFVVVLRDVEADATFTAVVPAADVHPVPPTPDPRDTAIAAVRALHTEVVIHAFAEDGHTLDEIKPMPSICRGCSAATALEDLDDGEYNEDTEGTVPWPCATLHALGGVVPVPAPAAPTPTGWTARRHPDGYITAVDPGGHTNGDDYWDDDTDDEIRQRMIGAEIEAAGCAAVLALRAEEAPAAAPATKDDDERLAEVVVRALWDAEHVTPEEGGPPRPLPGTDRHDLHLIRARAVLAALAETRR